MLFHELRLDNEQGVPVSQPVINKRRRGVKDPPCIVHDKAILIVARGKGQYDGPDAPFVGTRKTVMSRAPAIETAHNRDIRCRGSVIRKTNALAQYHRLKRFRRAADNRKKEQRYKNESTDGHFYFSHNRFDVISRWSIG